MARNKTVKKHAEEKISFIKKIYNSIKSWIVGNGIEGVLGFILGLVLWTFGYKIYAGFAFGVFATRNWDLLKSWVKGLLKK
jgi:hypothetical protein